MMRKTALLLLAIAAPGLLLAGPPLAAQGSQASFPSPTPPPTPAPGDVIAPFDAQGLDGVVRHVDFPKGTETLLIFFMAGCPHCQRMLPEWNRMFGMRPSNLAVVGVLMDREPPGFWDLRPVLFPVVRSPGIAFLHSLKVHRAPLLLRVAPGGEVEEVGLGELDRVRLGELFRR